MRCRQEFFRLIFLFYQMGVFMSYIIGKGQYVGKGGKSFPVQILNEENKVVEVFEVYGSHKSAKEKAQKRVKELTE